MLSPEGRGRGRQVGPPLPFKAISDPGSSWTKQSDRRRLLRGIENLSIPVIENLSTSSLMFPLLQAHGWDPP